jgi:hypothetical protein
MIFNKTFGNEEGREEGYVIRDHMKVNSQQTIIHARISKPSQRPD